MKVIAIANEKGGVGKTTTAVNLAVCLARKSRKVMLIDMDQQHNSTSTMGGRIDGKATLYDVLRRSRFEDGRLVGLEDTVQECHGVDLVPGDTGLQGLTAELTAQINGRVRLRSALRALEADSYDYVILDTPCSRGIMLDNALIAANAVLIPVLANGYSLDGLKELHSDIAQVSDAEEGMNPGLKILGVLLTQYNERLSVTAQTLGELKKDFPVLNVRIRKTTDVDKAEKAGMPVVVYRPSATAALDYSMLADAIDETDRR